VAVRGNDRKAIFRRQSALVNAKGALQRLPGPAASELLSLAAVGNHRPNWTPVPTRPPAAPRAAFKSQRDFVSQPKVEIGDLFRRIEQRWFCDGFLGHL
jgi:hypothetical protein